MKIRFITILVLAALMLTLLAACGSKNPTPISAEEAQKIVLEDAGLSASDVSDIHTHVGSQNNEPCYNIHITVDGVEYEYMIHGYTSEVLSTDYHN